MSVHETMPIQLLIFCMASAATAEPAADQVSQSDSVQPADASGRVEHGTGEPSDDAQANGDGAASASAETMPSSPSRNEQGATPKRDSAATAAQSSAAAKPAAMGGGRQQRRVLTLQRARDIAERNNVDVQIARERLEKAAITADKAWSILLPNIAGSGRVTRNNVEIEITLPPEELGQEPENIIVQQLWQVDGGFDLDWTLLNGRSIPLLKGAYTNEEVAEMQYKQVESTIRHATSVSFYNVLSAQQNVQVRKEVLDNAKANLALAERRKELGEATQIAVLRADVEVSTAEQNLIRARHALNLTKQSLATLLGWVSSAGRIPEFEVRRPPPLDDTVIPPQTELVRRAYDQRLDLNASRLQLEVAELNKTETWAKFIPSLGAFGRTNWSNAVGFANQNFTWQVGLQLTWNILQGGLRFWELQERQSDIDTAMLQIRQTRQDIAEQVLEARQDLRAARATQRAAERRLALAQQTAELIREQYRLGGAAQIDLLDAERSLAEAKAGAVRAALDADIARLALRQVIKTPPVQATRAPGGGAPTGGGPAPQPTNGAPGTPAGGAPATGGAAGAPAAGPAGSVGQPR